MLPRPRPRLDLYSTQIRNGSCTGRWARAYALVSLLVAAGCAEQSAQTPQTPAVSVPHGLLDLEAKTSKTTPRASAVTALAELTELSGLKYHSLRHDGADVAAMVEIDLTRFAPQILSKPKGVSPNRAIAEANVSVIVGSSFVSQVVRMQPLGVLQINGELLQNVEPHGYTRILGISDVDPQAHLAGRFEVVHRSQWPADGLHSAMQAGPGIIEQGLLDISERDLTRQKYFRSFVAECGERAVVGVTLVPMHLYTLGGELVQHFAANNLPCSEVVNLAGDREAVLLVRHAQKAAYLGDPQPLKVGLIGFSKRAR